MSIQILKSYAISMEQLKQGQKLVSFSREVKANSAKAYSVSRREGEAAELVLLGKSAFDAKLAALDPTKSLDVLINELSLPVVAASARMDEVYHLVAGKSIYPGTDPNPQYLDKSGLEKKIKKDGRAIADIAETDTSASGGIVTQLPIADAAGVTARKTGGALTVTSVTENLGEVALNDGASPIADGVAVAVAYPSIRHTVMNILEPKGVVAAVLASKELIDYLDANA